MEYFLLGTGSTIDAVVATSVAYEYGCKGDNVSVPQNVNYLRYINVSRHSGFLSWVSFFV